MTFFRIPYRVKLLYLFCRNFGFFTGIFLFIKIQSGYLSNIKLPGIKHPITLRPDTTDVQTFNQLFLDQEYEIDFHSPKTIIDGGANIGLFAIIMKNKYPDAKIICVEPDIENFNALKANVAAYDNIFCENYGIWNKNTKLKVYDKYHYGKWGIIVEENEINGTIPSITIDTLLRKHSIDSVDVLKLDIESSEKQVFAEGYSAWLPKVRTLVIEVHDWMVEGCRASVFNAINNTFSKYKTSSIGENIVVVNEDTPV